MADSAAMTRTEGAPVPAAPPTTSTAVDGWRRTDSADGTAIAWRRDGPADVSGRSHPTPVVLCNGIACSTDYWIDLSARLAATRPVVQWDYRGHGRSEQPVDVDAVGVDQLMDDFAAVLAASATDRAVIVGHSFGVQIALEAARRWPARVAGVVAVAGAPGAPLPATATRPGVGPLDLLARLHARTPDRTGDVWQAWWRSPVTDLFARAIGGTSQAVPRPVMRSYYEHVSTRDVGVLLAMVRTMQAHDASAIVPSLHVPLLVLAGDADRLTPLPAMARMALAAPDGELAVCHGATHTLPAEQPLWLVRQLQPLLDRVDARPHLPLEAAPGA